MNSYSNNKINSFLNSSINIKSNINNPYNNNIARTNYNPQYDYNKLENIIESNLNSNKDNLDNFSLVKEKINNHHKRNLSNVDFFLPKFHDTFVGGSYLNNLNDFHIKECASPKKERMLIISHLPNKLNKSSMDELSNIEPKYKDKANMVTTSWPLFHEK